MAGRSENSAGGWWGDFDIRRAANGCWRIGPGTFWIERREHEWRVLYRRGEDPNDTAMSVDIPAPEDCRPEDDDKLTRIAGTNTKDSITVRPAAADKAVVVRPEDPFYVMPGERVTMYVATPAWLQIYRASSDTMIFEQAVYQPSLTWFGATTVEGELCYASRVYGRLEFDEIVYKPHRIYTSIALRNEGPDSVLLERFNVPVPNLELFANDSGHLWTQQLTLEMKDKETPAELKLGRSAPEETGAKTTVARPRVKPEKNIINRALKSLIS